MEKLQSPVVKSGHNFWNFNTFQAFRVGHCHKLAVIPRCPDIKSGNQTGELFQVQFCPRIIETVQRKGSITGTTRHRPVSFIRDLHFSKFKASFNVRMVAFDSCGQYECDDRDKIHDSHHVPVSVPASMTLTWARTT